MSINIVMAHGFNVRDGGKASLDCLLPWIYYTTKQEADYGYVNLVKVRLCNNNIAGVIAGMAIPRSIGIGHSNGCTLLLKSAEMGAPFEQLIFINPALDNDVEIPPQIDQVFVYHNPTDRAVLASRFLLFHPWGDMGRSGYCGADTRVSNYNLESMGYEGHTGHRGNPQPLAEHIHNQIQKWQGSPWDG